MDKEAKKILKQFQNEIIRLNEENFAQILSEKDDVKLFFINEDQAFTDGTNIVVDPSFGDLFCDRVGLQKICDFLKWDFEEFFDMWNALSIITRAQTIHECLHLLYSDFPSPVLSDLKCDTKLKKMLMSNIHNIIEDAYIEAVGCSVYDNMEYYLKFSRIGDIFVSKKIESTSTKVFKKDVEDLSQNTGEDEEKKREQIRKFEILTDYLNYMGFFLLYPMFEQPEPSSEISEYVKKTKQLFIDGSFAPSPAQRYDYVGRIFDVVMPLLPEIEDTQNLNFTRTLFGHAQKEYQASMIGAKQRKGKSQAVVVRLFANRDLSPRQSETPLEAFLGELKEFSKLRDRSMSLLADIGKLPYTLVYKGSDYGANPVHTKIKINEIHPKINLGLKTAYGNIYKKYRIHINSYHNKFEEIMKMNIPTRETKLPFGSGIDSKMLADLKKRYWYKNTPEVEVVDLSVILLIDGSGSMWGKRIENAMKSAIILHEVLKKQGIEHAVVEHRAISGKAEMDINVLLSFGAREEEKYNLMQLHSEDTNRDALALLWANKYIQTHSKGQKKLMIVISDGLPFHDYDDYSPPVSIKDTANTVKKIINQGTDIVAIALDDGESLGCYEDLKEIYPNLVSCNDLNRLTAQLLDVVKKMIPV